MQHPCYASRKGPGNFIHGCFYSLRVLFSVGVLIIGDLVFAIYTRAPEFWKLSNRLFVRLAVS